MTGLALAFLVAMTPEERDLLPLPRYVDEEQVSSVVLAAVPAWQPCAGAVSGAVSGAAVAMRLVFGPDGRVREAYATVPGSAPPVVSPGADCWLSVARTLDVGLNDEDSVSVGFWLAVVDGAIVAPVSVDLDPRPLDPLFLFVPPDLDPDRRAEILRILGLDEGESQPRSSTLPSDQPDR